MDGWGGVNFTVRTDASPPDPFAVTVTPSSNSTNSFAFSWGAAVDHESGLNQYYWSVNGGAETATTSISVPAGARATQSGTNTLNVRAVDNVGNSRNATATFTLSSASPCDGREIPHSCVPSTQCYPAATANLQTLPTMSSEQWLAIGQPVREMLQDGARYSIGFEYRSVNATALKVGFSVFNAREASPGLVVCQFPLPTSPQEWHPFWSAPFTVTADQLKRFSSLRFAIEHPEITRFEISNVRIMSAN